MYVRYRNTTPRWIYLSSFAAIYIYPRHGKICTSSRFIINHFYLSSFFFPHPYTHTTYFVHPHPHPHPHPPLPPFPSPCLERVLVRCTYVRKLSERPPSPIRIQIRPCPTPPPSKYPKPQKIPRSGEKREVCNFFSARSFVLCMRAIIIFTDTVRSTVVGIVPHGMKI